MTVKTRAQLKSENASDFPDNTLRLISPASLRGQMDDIVDSALFPEDDIEGPPGPPGPPVEGYVVETSADAAYDYGTGLWSGTDAHTEIQLRIDEHVYELIGEAARLGNGRWLLGRGLQLGYGDAIGGAYRSGRLKGSGVAFNGDGFAGVALGANFSDEPMVNIQGARFSEVSDICLNGVNRQWIQDSDLGSPTRFSASHGGLDDKDIANWINPALDARADSRYAPFAIIAVDGRSGASQPDHYRDVDYSFLGVGVAQYNKALSSHVHIRRFHLRGGYVGVVIHPNDTDGNGDFVNFADGIIADCAVGIHTSQTQARNVAITNVIFSKVHTVFSNSMFGRQTGRFQGPIIGAAAEHFINFFDFNSTSITGSVAFIGCYGEAGYRIGNINASSSVEQEISLIDCDFSFDNQTTVLNQGGVATTVNDRGVPATMVRGAASGSGQLFPFRVTGGMWSNWNGVAFLNLPIEGVVIDGLVLRGNEFSDTVIIAEPKRRAHMCARNGFAGGLCFPQLGYGQRSTKINPKFLPYNLDTGAVVASPMNIGDRFRSNRAICTPLWAERHCASSGLGDQGVVVPRKRVGGIYQGPGASGFDLVLTGITLTGTVPPGNLVEHELMSQGGMPGDVILLDAYSTVAVIETLNTGTGAFTATLINNYRGTTPINPITIASGACYLGCMRYYSPALPIYGRFTSGSPIITEVSQSPFGAEVNAAPETHIGVGDYIVLDDIVAPFLTQANAKIVSRNNAAFTITLNGNATASSTGRGLSGGDRVRIGTLSRALP